MTTNSDATADTPDPKQDAGAPEGSGEPSTSAESVPDGSGNNTGANNTEDDSASGGPA